jgi:hypothetical protein
LGGNSVVAAAAIALPHSRKKATEKNFMVPVCPNYVCCSFPKFGKKQGYTKKKEYFRKINGTKGSVREKNALERKVLTADHQ